jgi:ABC-2 type transport system permease protein
MAQKNSHDSRTLSKWTVFLAFLRRDFAEEWSYPLVIAAEFFRLCGTLIALYFIALLFKSGETTSLLPYGSSYFPFAVIGLIGGEFLWVSMRGHSLKIRQHQLMGTLEACLMTRANLFDVVMGAPAYPLVRVTIRAVIYLSVLGCLFGYETSPSAGFTALLIWLLSVLIFLALGVISASITLVIKRGDPLAYAINGIAWLCGGILYPTSLLPEWAKTLSYLVPITPMLDSVRALLLAGAGYDEVLFNLVWLLGYGAAVLPIAFFSFKAADRHLATHGALESY